MAFSMKMSWSMSPQHDRLSAPRISVKPDDMAVSEEFMAQGGTEVGCMSTTEDEARAYQDALKRPY
jgi:hypothetical protein